MVRLGWGRGLVNRLRCPDTVGREVKVGETHTVHRAASTCWGANRLGHGTRGREGRRSRPWEGCGGSGWGRRTASPVKTAIVRSQAGGYRFQINDSVSGFGGCPSSTSPPSPSHTPHLHLFPTRAEPTDLVQLL